MRWTVCWCCIFCPEYECSRLSSWLIHLPQGYSLIWFMFLSKWDTLWKDLISKSISLQFARFLCVYLKKKKNTLILCRLMDVRIKDLGKWDVWYSLFIWFMRAIQKSSYYVKSGCDRHKLDTTRLTAGHLCIVFFS